jgi:predicted dehydrogenase
LGALFDGGIHVIAGLSMLFGPPQTVLAAGQKLREGYGDYDHTHMAFRYANGISGSLSHSNFVPSLGTHFHIYGTQGLISLERDRVILSKPGLPDRVVDAPFENPYGPMWQAIGAAYRNGPALYYTPQHALRDVAILEAVARSLAGGQSADVEPIAV